MFGIKFDKKEFKDSCKKVTGYLDDKVDKLVTGRQARAKAEAEHSLRVKELELEILKVRLEMEKVKSNNNNK